jgi:regulator of sigma E protease
MLDILISIVSFIVAIGVLVAVHEFGHFWVAKKLGIKVLRFSIGFGRPWMTWRGRGPDYTEFWLATIPLGGYVKLLDEREAPVPAPERERAFNRRPVAHRIAVLLAGPGFNFVFAVLAYWIMFVSGVPGVRPVVSGITPGSVAAMAGLEVDDEIIAVRDQPAETLEVVALAMLDELLAEGRIQLSARDASGEIKTVVLAVEGREAELTEPDALFDGLGLRLGYTIPPVVGEVVPGQSAAAAGLAPGDRVLASGGRPIHSWTQWVEFIRERPGETVPVTLRRDGQELDLMLAIGSIDEQGKTVGRIGAGVDTELAAEAARAALTEQRYGLFEALPQGLRKTWEISALTIRVLVRMVVGDVSVRNISGPINIATYAGDSAQAGFTAFLSFLSVVSISLGILNLLPIPLLDGGQVVYQIAEWVKGAPLSERAMLLGQQVGIFLLMILMGFAFYNDLTRIFS